MKDIHVVGAVISRDGMILCTRRGPHGALPGLWEFPGGKIEPGESPSEALVREIREELGCEVEVGELVDRTTHQYEFGRVHLTTFHCRVIEGEVVLSEHSEMRWLKPLHMEDLKWAPADVPAVQKLKAAVADGR